MKLTPVYISITLDVLFFKPDPHTVSHNPQSLHDDIWQSIGQASIQDSSSYTLPPHNLMNKNWVILEKFLLKFIFISKKIYSICKFLNHKVSIETSYLMSTMWLFEFRQSSLLYRFPIPQKRLFAEDECWEDDSSIHCDHSPFGTLLYSKQGQFSFSDIFRSLLRVSNEGKLFKLNRENNFILSWNLGVITFFFLN